MLCIYYFLIKRRKLLGQPNILVSTNHLMYYFLYDIHTLCLSLGCNNRNPIRVLCHLFWFLGLTIRLRNVKCKYKNKIVCIFGMNSINIPHITCDALYMYISLNRWPPYISNNHILGPIYRDRLRVAFTKTMRRMKKHAEQEGWGWNRKEDDRNEWHSLRLYPSLSPSNPLAIVFFSRASCRSFSSSRFLFLVLNPSPHLCLFVFDVSEMTRTCPLVPS